MYVLFNAAHVGLRVTLEAKATNRPLPDVAARTLAFISPHSRNGICNGESKNEVKFRELKRRHSIQGGTLFEVGLYLKKYGVCHSRVTSYFSNPS